MKKTKITQVQGEALVHANQTDIWEVVKHFGNISDFHPLVKRSYATNQVQGVGATRHCQLIPVGVMEEEVTKWQEGSGMTAKVIGGKMLPPCHFMHGKLELTPVPNGTLARFTFSYQMKYGILGQLMNHLFIKPQFKSAPIKYANGLKNYVELSKASKAL
ncbi:MAG: SRPBCC family protein [Bacteroidota bacterium]